MSNVIPDLDEVQRLLDALVGEFPDAYEKVCEICDLLGLRHPPDPR